MLHRPPLRSFWVLPCLAACVSCSDSEPEEAVAPNTGLAGGPSQVSAGAAALPPEGSGNGGDPSAGGAGPGTEGTDVVTSGDLSDNASSSSGAASDAGTAGGDRAADAGLPELSADSDRCDVGVWDGSAPEVLQLSGNTFAHDPTMIQVDGTYYRFWTGNFIPAATSTNLTQWSNAPSVYGGSYSDWVTDWLNGVNNPTFNFPWAPDVSAFGGAVHLYSSFSARFGDNISCITHLSTTNIAAGDWTDHGPVICTEGNESYNAIDADVALDLDGTPILSFGSFWDGILAFELQADGSSAGGPLTRLAWNDQIEAPVILRRCGYYYLFVTWGLCCPGEGRSVDDLTYRVVVGRSTNILGPYVDRDGVPMLERGGTPVTQGDGVSWAAAGHSDVLVDGDRMYHFYHAYAQSNGAASLRIAELYFDEEGWPVPHAP